jgi:hypothetical protein
LAIDYIKPVYNINTTAGSRLGIPHTAETKEKISAAQKGKMFLPETRVLISTTQKGNKNAIGHIPSNRKAVSVYTLENVFVQSFNSLTEAAGRSRAAAERQLNLLVSRKTLFLKP